MTDLLHSWIRVASAHTLVLLVLVTVFLGAYVTAPTTDATRPDPLASLTATFHRCWGDDGRAHPNPSVAITRTTSGALKVVSADRGLQHLDSVVLFCDHARPTR